MLVNGLSAHVPPLRHGDVKHELSCNSQNAPVVPAAHRHVTAHVADEQFVVDAMHCALLRQGDETHPFTKSSNKANQFSSTISTHGIHIEHQCNH